ncbi:hypothetical protein LBMAG56_34110 [Verrucomicrobiota bacterium]|nr:hypothetical protein LBMAG56_34110 [Verrucomicrobiota bacterium]
MNLPASVFFQPARRCQPLPLVILILVALAPTLALAADLLPPGHRPQPPAVHALVGAKVVISPTQTLDPATIVIRDGRIEAVGKDFAAPADARVWNLKGATIYAGFIDPYLSLSSGGPAAPVSTAMTIPITAASGINFFGIESPERGGPPGAGYEVARVSPQLRVADTYAPNSKTLEELREIGFTSGNVVPAKGIFRGTSAFVLLGDGNANQAILKADVFQHLAFETARGEDRAYPSSLMGIIAVTRQALLDAQHHKLDHADYAKNPARPRPAFNPALQALDAPLQKQIPVVIEPGSALMFDRAARLAREFNLAAILCASGHEWRRPDLAKAAAFPCIVPINFPAAPKLPDEDDWADVSLDQLRAWDFAPENPVTLRRQGLEIALTTHALGDRKSFRKNLQLALDRGLTEADALAALTTIPAKLCGLSAQLGTIEKGKLANLTIVDGPSYFDPEQKIREVWIEGRQFPTQPPAPPKTAAKNSEAKTPDAKLAETKNLETKAAVTNAPALKPATPPLVITTAGSGNTVTITTNITTFTTNGATATATVIVSTSSSSSSSTTGKTNTAATATITITTTEAPKPDAPKTDPAKTDPAKTNSTTAATLPTDKPKSTPAQELRDLHKKRVAKSPQTNRGPLAAPRAIFIKDATLWTCGPAGKLEHANLLAIDGRIVRLGTNAVLQPGDPSGKDLLELDGRGLHVTPGIIDAHSHSMILGDVNEGTLPSTAMVRIADVINSETENIYQQLAGGVTAANLLHGSANPIGGQNAVIKLRFGATPEQMKFAEAPAGIKFALGENVKQSNWGPKYTTRFPQSRMGVPTFMDNRFTAARQYLDALDRQKKTGGPPIRRNLELEALGEILLGQRWIHCHSYRQDEIVAFLRTMESFNIQVASLQHVLEGYKVADEIARHGAGGSTFSDWWAFKFEVYDAIPYNGSLMRDRGVVVSFNSDSSDLARRLYLDAAKAVKYGNTPEIEALKFVTLNPAKQLRIDQHVGSLEPGKHADFALWSRAPLDSATVCQQTWIDGKKYFDRSLSTARAQSLEAERSALITKAKKISSPPAGTPPPSEAAKAAFFHRALEQAHRLLQDCRDCQLKNDQP